MSDYIIMCVSESDILGPIDYLSDIENLVSFERAITVLNIKWKYS